MFSYTLGTGTGSTAGDLSNGTLLAHSGSVIAVDGDRIVTDTLTTTEEASNIPADKIIIATVEQIGTSTDVSAQLLIKYHYQ